jgi:hypothetical protein
MLWRYPQGVSKTRAGYAQDAADTRACFVLPVDGRYNETVMDKISGLVASFLLGVRSGRIVSAPSRRHEYW